MWSDELAGGEALNSTYPREDLAALVQDADAVGELRDVDPAPLVEVYVAGAEKVVPLFDISAIEREYLDPVVLAVSDVDALTVDPDAVGEVELTRAYAGFAPALKELTFSREAVDAAVTVAVGDVEVAVRGLREVGGLVEGLPGGRWPVLLTEGEY